MGQGVCQDMAQIAVSLMRATGLPARYVLRLPAPRPEGRAGQQVSRPVARLGRVLGRLLDRPRPPPAAPPSASATSPSPAAADYGDVPPLKGIYHGPPDSDMQVTVEGHPRLA